MRRAGFTARGVDRLIRVARTIADLEGRDVIDAGAIFEAASFRALDLDPVVDPRLPPLPPSVAPARGPAPAAVTSGPGSAEPTTRVAVPDTPPDTPAAQVLETACSG